MKITIYRPKQIGGQVTRISTDKACVIIDLGHNLPNNRTQKDALAAEVDNITQGCSAIFYTHYHGDHIGLFHHVEANIPQYMGKVAKQVLCKKYEVLSLIPVEQQQTDYTYIKENTIKEEYVQMEKRFASSVHLHTSGHATIPVLKQVCQLVNPSTAIIPIHREVDADFASVVGLSAKQKEKVINSSTVMNDIEIEFID